MTIELILASSSPRRQEMLRQVGLNYTIRKANIDESIVTINDPKEKVKQLAALKGRHVTMANDEVILSADTVVAYKNHIFEKPKTKDDAYDMIASLSGDIHDVFTGVMIRSAEREHVFVEQTEVEFWQLSEQDIQWYIHTDEPYDKAGAYGIQNLGSILVKRIIGDYFNVVGLPISRVVRELQTFGVSL